MLLSVLNRIQEIKLFLIVHRCLCGDPEILSDVFRCCHAVSGHVIAQKKGEGGEKEKERLTDLDRGGFEQRDDGLGDGRETELSIGDVERLGSD